jgi:hypothetical protein
MTTITNQAEYLEHQFSRAQADAVNALRDLAADCQDAVEAIEDRDCFVSTFPGGQITFSGSKAEGALARLAHDPRPHGSRSMMAREIAASIRARLDEIEAEHVALKSALAALEPPRRRGRRVKPRQPQRRQELASMPPPQPYEQPYYHEGANR